MIQQFRAPLSLFAGWLILIALGGCASREPLPSYYVLSSGSAARLPATSHPGVRLFIRRVTLPGYLQPSRMASRRAKSEIDYSPTAFWTEGLPEEFGSALARALSRRPGIGAVSQPPLGLPPPRDYDLVVEIERLEGDDRGEVVLAARWQLHAPESAAPILSRRSLFIQPGWAYGDEANQARMLGLNVQEMAAQIARAIPRPPPAAAVRPVAG